MASSAEIVALFDRAMVLRDSGAHEDASRLLRELADRAGPDDRKLHAHALTQLAHIARTQGRLVDAEADLRTAVELAPRSELASLSWFLVLADLGRGNEALTEAVRYLSLRESLGYRELFDEMSLGRDIDRSLGAKARALLAAHRESQRAREAPVVGDTVHVRAGAPSNARPGSLAELRSVDSERAKIRFSDGVAVEIVVSWLDHHDI